MNGDSERPAARSVVVHFLDRYYILPVLLMAILVSCLQSHLGCSLLSSYEDFRDIILAGFDADAIQMRSSSPTSPMWGFAFVLLLTETPVCQLILQNVLAVSTLGVFLHYLKSSKTLTPTEVLCLKAAFIVCIPWYALHASRGPNSFAISLLLLGMVYFHKSLLEGDGRLRHVLVSGLLFGTLLNFRSDCLYLTGALALTALVLNENRLRVFCRLCLWGTCIGLMLVPWALYTKQTCGHYLAKSTNSGHVFYVGLGNYPNNKWGITFSDGDKSMHAYVDDCFRRHPSEASQSHPDSTLTYEADVVLQHRFRELVRDDPVEYIKKCAYTFAVMVVRGPWEGTFLDRDVRKEILHTNPLRFLDKGFRGVVSLISLVEAMCLSVACFLLFPLAAIKACRERNTLLILIVEILAYQVAIIVFAAYMRNYLTNVVTLMIVVSVVGASSLTSVLRGRGRHGSARTC